MKWRWIVSTIMFIISGVGWASDSGGLDQDDLRLSKVAKEKSYPGGRDEEDLEVLPQLTKPTRKVGDNTKVEFESSSDEEF